MVTKAIIESIESEYEVTVRIPMLDAGKDFSTSTSTTNLAKAIICVPPKCMYSPAIGDVVIVSFEDNDYGKPVILGCLSKKSGNESSTSIDCSVLNVSGAAKLSDQTSIGDISYSQLQYLANTIGVADGVQNELNNLPFSSTATKSVLTKPLVSNGVKNNILSKFVLDDVNGGRITNQEEPNARILLGFLAKTGGATDLLLGHKGYRLYIRGSTTRPVYEDASANLSDLALYSDIASSITYSSSGSVLDVNNPGNTRSLFTSAVKFPDGTLINYGGYYKTDSGAFSVTFKEPFIDTKYSISVSAEEFQSIGASQYVGGVQAYNNAGNPKTTTGCYLFKSYDEYASISWMAIGRWK